MLSRIKIIGVIFLSILLLTNCKKENGQDNSLQQGDLVFSSINISMDKSDDVPCGDLVPTQAKVVISGKVYLPQVYIIDGNIFTQAIKLEARGKKYILEEFSIIDEFGAVIRTTPMEGSEYAEFVQNPLPRDIFILPLETTEMAMEVLCFYPDQYQLFGFEFFEIGELSIRKLNFAGNICISDPQDYWYSMYGNPGDISVNEMAIFKIRVFRNGDFIKEYDNEDKHFLVEPLTIPYADYVNVMDLFRFELWIYVKVGNDFAYVKFHEWKFYDDEGIKSGQDGIVDFVLGNCNLTTPDLLLPPYLNLPGNFTYTVITMPNPNGTYRVKLSHIGDGYDIDNGVYDAWSADFHNNIYEGIIIHMNSFSSLYPNLLPGDWKEKGDKLAACNWLINHKDDYASKTVVLQNALWYIFDDIPTKGLALTMAQDALMQTDFSPLPGEYAAVLFFHASYSPDNRRNVQISFQLVES